MTKQSELHDALSDEDLALLCAQRPVNEQAWNVFYMRFYRFVYGKIRRNLQLPVAEMDEVVQEAFTRIFEVMPFYDPNKALLKTYMSRVITNLAIDCWRHGALERALTASLEDDIRALQVSDPDAVHHAAEAIVEAVPDQRKLPLVVAFIHGEDVKTIRAMYGESKEQIYGARTWLRTWLRKAAGNQNFAKSLNKQPLKNRP